MIPGMIAKGMAGLGGFFHQRGETLDVLPDPEKGGGDVIGFQNVENGCG